MDGNAKQQIVERIKNSTNILVTVSRNPSVDELTAALGFTMMLNKMDKHATAVFSGAIPPAISFLEPDKTFEHSVDSLRDFIIALDKEKADRLRYKVEDDVVRIFITPYKTTISEKDLQFSQGDFNVELIVALGVDKREDLDNAITAHGRILHDATVVTINTDDEKNTLGTIDWQDTAASSYSEMLVSLSEALQNNLIDAQIATSLLTGIVAATKRFANTHTTPRVMTMAAQLMAAGANQQLIAAKLEEAQAIPKQSTPIVDKNGATPLDEGKSKKLDKAEKKPKKESKPEPEPEPTPPPRQDGEMQIEHSDDKAKKKEAPKPKPAPAPATQSIPTPPPEPEPVVPAQKTDEEADRELDEAIAAATASEEAGDAKKKSSLSVEDLKKDLAAASRDVDAAAADIGATPPTVASTLPPVTPQPAVQVKSDWRTQQIPEPRMGGTLNATTHEAAEQKRREAKDERNRTILTHDKPALGAQEVPPTPFNSYAPGTAQAEPPSVDPFAAQAPPPSGDNFQTVSTLPNPAPAAASAPAPVAPAPQAAPNDLGDARQAVEQAFGSAPFDAAHQPMQSVGAQPLGPSLHDQPATGVPAPAIPAMSPDVGMPLPPPPPPPDLGAGLPPLPPANASGAGTPVQQASASPAPATLPPIAPPSTPTPTAIDPGQFKIPGQ